MGAVVEGTLFIQPIRCVSAHLSARRLVGNNLNESWSRRKMLLFFWFPPNLTGVKLEIIIIIRLIFNLMAQISQILSHRKMSSQLLFVIPLTWEFSPALNKSARNALVLFWSVIDLTLFNQFLVWCSHPQSCQTFGQDLWWVFWFVCLFVWW